MRSRVDYERIVAPCGRGSVTEITESRCSRRFAPGIILEWPRQRRGRLRLYDRVAYYVSELMNKKFRVFATCDIGEAIELLRQRGYEVEVYPHPEAPPKSLIVEKVKSGVDGLITTLRDPIDAEVFEAGKGTLKVVAQIAVGFDNINRADANRYKIPFTHTADVLTEATAEFAFFMMGTLARKMWTAEHLTRENQVGILASVSAVLGG